MNGKNSSKSEAVLIDLEDNVGYKHIKIKPDIGGQLTYVNAIQLDKINKMQEIYVFACFNEAVYSPNQL